MPVRVTGRHFRVGKEIRSYLEAKMPRIEKYTDRLHNVDVVLEKDGYQFRAEMRLKAGMIEVTAKTVDPDVMRAVDLLIDKVERQLQKRTQKLRGNKKHGGKAAKLGRAALESEEMEEAGEAASASASSKSNGNGQAARPVRRASGSRGSNLHADLAGSRQPVLAENVGVHIFPAKRTAPGAMSLEDAAEELFFNGDNFICFINEDNQQLNVMYRRNDGQFGLVEPKAE